jgi:hypothetical protein
MTTEQELRQKLHKISALFEGATTAGERDAAQQQSIGCGKPWLPQSKLNSQ